MRRYSSLDELFQITGVIIITFTLLSIAYDEPLYLMYMTGLILLGSVFHLTYGILNGWKDYTFVGLFLLFALILGPNMLYSYGMAGAATINAGVAAIITLIELPVRVLLAALGA